MNRKQRRRQIQQRRAHASQMKRPQHVLKLARYPVVKQGHIVSATYQRNFAIDGGVAVHVPGREDCVTLKVENAGTRSRAYRRTRPDGTEIDDVEATLAVVEGVAGPVLRSVVAGGAIDPLAKSKIAQFMAVQMLRGPMFFKMASGIAIDQVEQAISIDTVSAKILAEAGGDIEAVRSRAVDALGNKRFHDMIRGSQKLGTILGFMHWQLIHFASPVVVYSDQPVFVWPLATQEIRARPTAPKLGPVNALEIRIPISPNLILLLTWKDQSDATVPAHVPPELAADTNSLVVAQADKQWMHRPGPEPPISSRLIQPISAFLDPAYDHRVVMQSARRQQALKYMRRVIGKPFVNTAQVITDVTVERRSARR